jgi:hypothetical protein
VEHDRSLEPYLRRARTAGIARTVMFAPFHSDYAQANAEVARIIARHPRLVGFAFVHAARDAGRIFEMVQHAPSSFDRCKTPPAVLVHRLKPLANRLFVDHPNLISWLAVTDESSQTQWRGFRIGSQPGLL